MNTKGVTLIELLVVIAIMSILAMIAIPTYLGQKKSATRTEAYTNLENLRLLEEQYYAENSCYSPGCNSSNYTTIAAIQAFLPAFRPGPSLNFDYRIDTTVSSACFSATAAGKSGSRVSGDTFTIDCNNNKNF